MANRATISSVLPARALPPRGLEPQPGRSAVLAIAIHGASLIPVGILDHQILSSLRLSEPEPSVDTESTAS